jgi:cysteine desulfurase / selenocysteine lyase
MSVTAVPPSVVLPLPPEVPPVVVVPPWRRPALDAAAIDPRDLVGSDVRVPLLDGGTLPYVNLDNAASTPALCAVAEAVDRFLPWSSGVHRGTGHKSQVSTAAYEHARAQVGRFLGADPDRDVVVFVRNTTEAVNKAARTLDIPEGSVVITTVLEHHSNDLPWRARARTLHARARPDGSLDEEHLDHLLAAHAGRVALLAVTGASNVTGVVPPIHRLAEKVHAVGGRILVDAAQLAPHRPIDVRPHDDPGHLDLVALSGHKLYAPYGSGVLVGPRTAFAARPDQPGGGTVAAVTLDEVAWADLPDREEAGSPNVVGAVALAAATTALAQVGHDRLRAHEGALTASLATRLGRIPGVAVHGPPVRGRGAVDRVGVVPFSVRDVDHHLVAAVLAAEHGIGVRSGCFCAHPYIAHLLGLGEADVRHWAERVSRGDRSGAPGLVRASLGGYSTSADADRLVTAVSAIAAGEVRGTYLVAPDGTFAPARDPHRVIEAAGPPWAPPR